jgi:hypothetical protein
VFTKQGLTQLNLTHIPQTSTRTDHYFESVIGMQEFFMRLANLALPCSVKFKIEQKMSKKCEQEGAKSIYRNSKGWRKDWGIHFKFCLKLNSPSKLINVPGID